MIFFSPSAYDKNNTDIYPVWGECRDRKAKMAYFSQVGKQRKPVFFLFC